MCIGVSSRGVQGQVELKVVGGREECTGKDDAGANALRVGGRLRSGLVSDVQNRALYAQECA